MNPEKLEAGGIPRQDDRKPDPSEPWRFVCPECGGQVRGRHGSRGYLCGVCDGYWQRDELHDKKPQPSERQP